MLEILVFIFVFASSYLGVELFRRWSLRRELFDIPNERSSHTTPTPRGGGAVIVVLSLSVYSVYTIFVTGGFNWAYAAGAFLIAIISWFDDLHTISFYWRFLSHAFAAILVIFSSGYFQEIFIPGNGRIELGVVGMGLTFFWIVWLTNAYNFMDGIDGIAGIQAVTAGIGWLLIGKFLGWNTIGFYGGVIAFTSLGFLIQNWQPAKIFMGDVGSAFLGYSFAVLPILSEKGAQIDDKQMTYLLISALVLVWLFVFDTVLTFTKRLLKGEKVWQAHRSHIYQKLVQAGHSHRAITSLYGSISVLNLLVLFLWLIDNEEADKLIFLLLLLCFQGLGLVIYLFYIQRKTRRIPV